MALLAYFQRHVILEDGFVRLQRGSVAHYIPEHGQDRGEELDAAGRRSGQDVISRTARPRHPRYPLGGSASSMGKGSSIAICSHPSAGPSSFHRRASQPGRPPLRKAG